MDEGSGSLPHTPKKEAPKMCTTCEMYYDDKQAFWQVVEALGLTKTDLAEDEDFPESISCPTCSSYL